MVAETNSSDPEAGRSEFQPSVEVRLTDQEQFSIRIGSEQRSGDLYYLGIDPRRSDHDCSPVAGLANLIGGWITTIEENEDGQIFYLPFDFSDEFTRWVASEKRADQITFVFGWAAVEGWSFSPSEFSEHSRSLETFQADEPVNPQSFYLPRVFGDLRRCRAALAGMETTSES